jgi:hypothetical protein
MPWEPPGRDVVLPTYPERSLWTLVKDARTARAMVRVHPLGDELRVLVASELLWSQVFRQGDVPSLEVVAETHRLGFLERGWAEAT